MRVGEMKDEVLLIEPRKPFNTFGQPEVTEQARASVWGKIEELAQRDIARFRQAGMQSSCRVTIRILEDITNQWRVEIRGLRYQIESITHIDRRWTELGVVRQDS